MALVMCPDCGNPISGDAVWCPKCGRQGSRKRNQLIAAAIAIVVAGGTVLGSRVVRDNATHATVRIKAVHSGLKEQVAHFYELLPNCELAGYPEVTVVRSPGQGTVSTEPGKTYTEYDRENARFECNQQLAGATMIFYQSNAGFHGRDSFAISVRFPDSNQWTESYIVNVL